MSEDAKTLMYWISNAKSAFEVNEGTEERDYCLACAFKWARSIIASSFNKVDAAVVSGS